MAIKKFENVECLKINKDFVADARMESCGAGEAIWIFDVFE